LKLITISEKIMILNAKYKKNNYLRLFNSFHLFNLINKILWLIIFFKKNNTKPIFANAKQELKQNVNSIFCMFLILKYIFNFIIALLKYENDKD